MENFPSVYHERVRFRLVHIQDISGQQDNPNDRDRDLRQKSSSSVRPIQFLVKFVYKEFDQETRERSLQFDMDRLKNYDDSHVILSTMLALVGVKRDDATHEHVVKKIIHQGLKIGNRVCNMGRTVLGLRVVIKREQVKFRCQRCSRERRVTQMEEELNNIEELMAEFEAILMNINGNDNLGMVPASDLSIKKILKRVRVGDDDDDDDDAVEEEGREGKRRRIRESESCTVCMEEFKAGGSEEVLACMPCSHVFHEECIETWLRQSHYCPVCRFEVPTTDD